LKIWDVKNKAVDFRSSKKYLEVSCLSWNNSNSLLAFGTSTGEIDVIDFKKRTSIASYTKKNYDGIKTLKFSPYSKNFICSGCKDGSVGVYSLQQPDLVSRYWKHHTKVLEWGLLV
jgi:WD40 repeat protein